MKNSKWLLNKVSILFFLLGILFNNVNLVHAEETTTSPPIIGSKSTETKELIYPKNLEFIQDENGVITVPEYVIKNETAMDYNLFGFTIVGNDGWKTVDESYKFEYVNDLSAKFKIKIGNEDWKSLINEVTTDIVIPANSTLEVKWDVELSASSEFKKYMNAFTVTANIGSQIDKCYTIMQSTSDKTYGIKEYKCYIGNPYGLPEISDVEIPDKIQGKTITFANTNSFNNRKLTSVVMNESMEWLGSYSFSDNYIKSVDLKNVKKLGVGVNGSTFSYNKIEEIDISKVESFNIREFQYNNISKITWNSSKTTVLKEDMFNNNPELKELFIPKMVTEIESNVFKNCGLNSIVFEADSQLVKIGQSAFEGRKGINNVTNLIIPDKVEYIDKGAFANLGIVNLTLNKNLKTLEHGNALFKGVFENNNIEAIDFAQSPLLETLGAYTFKGNKLTGVYLPASIKNIGAETFRNNQITNFKMENGFTSIPDYYLADNLLTSFDSPTTITSIGKYAFAYTPLETITYSNVLTKIDNNAFYRTNLTDVMLPDSVQFIGNDAYSNCKITRLKLSSSLNFLGESAFTNNQIVFLDLTQVPLLSKLSYGVFNSNHIENIIIPTNITTLEGLSLANNRLSAVNILGKVTLNQYATQGVFDNNKALLESASINVPLGFLDYYLNVESFKYFGGRINDPNQVLKSIYSR